MRRNRPLGTATVMVLNALRAGHSFGLDLMNATGLPSGTVYPTLTMLERRGFVTASWEDEGVARAEGRPKRRYYVITELGDAALDGALERLGLPAPKHARQEG